MAGTSLPWLPRAMLSTRLSCSASPNTRDTSAMPAGRRYQKNTMILSPEGRSRAILRMVCHKEDGSQLKILDGLAISDSSRSVGRIPTDCLHLKEPRRRQPNFGIQSCCPRACLGAVQAHAGGMLFVFLRPLHDARLQGCRSGSLLQFLRG